MKKRIFSLLLALVLLLGVLPVPAMASGLGQVRVIVENTTYPVSSGAPWDGTLVDTNVTLAADSTMMRCIQTALEQNGFQGEGFDMGYISSINGLKELAGGRDSGWMGTLNDWFTDVGFSSVTDLADGDVIRVMYTCSRGADIGGEYGTNQGWLSSLTASVGVLSPAFSMETLDYTLTVDADAETVDIKASAENKQDKVTVSVNGTEYRRGENVPVADGAEIAIVCGAKTYTVTVDQEAQEAASYTVTLPSGEGFTASPAGDSASPVEAGGSYSFTVTILDGYEKSGSFAVKANETVLLEADGVYTIENIQNNQVVTVEGVQKKAEQGSVPVTLSGMHSAQVSDLKLYTYQDGEKGESNLLGGLDKVENGYQYQYETSLIPGDYWVDGYDANDAWNGGLKLTVPEEGGAFTIQRIYQIYATNSGWVKDVDYSIDVTATDAQGSERQIALGEADSWGTVYTSCIFVVGDTVSATFTPLGERAESAVATTVSKTPTSNTNLTASIPLAHTITITAPAGSTISAGIFRSYYIYEFVEPEVTENDGVVTASFRMPEASSGYHFYRVQNPDGVTYWDFAKWTADTTIEVTAEDLYLDSGTFASDTVYRFDQNVYDMANLYLNANGRGCLNLDVGETYELNVFRNWMAIESFMNAKVGLPDMHYTVVDEDGNPSDILTITPDGNNSCVVNMTANHAGTAIVLVTYDAMTCVPAMGGSQFSAIWPECTGVIVVTVGADGSAIQTNMTMDRLDSATTALDAELDYLFYVGEEGASYTFTPEEGCTVTVNRSVVTDSMTFRGFTSSGVTVDADGAVTVSGLTTGRHIIKVEKDGLAAYQVVTARQVSYELQDADGNPLTDSAEIRAGDTIQIQFSDLLNPLEKMSGAYNCNASLYYFGEEGTSFKSNPGSGFGVYDFGGNSARQKITISIPKYWTGDAYSLHGAIKMGGFTNGPAGYHRGFTYAKGSDPGFNADSAGMILSRLPEISIALAETNFLTAQLRFEDQNGNVIERSGLTITLTDGSGNRVAVEADGRFQCVADTYQYVITGQGVQYATGSLEVTEAGENTFTIVLQTSSENAWDGVTETEPEQDENDVYLISNGAELAWFSAQNQKAAQDISGKLTADIDLGCYPWNNTASYSGRATVLDGDGHTVCNLNASRGLFGALGSGSEVKNLTVQGTSTGGSAITAYARGAVIESCVSDVNISGSGSNVGGIAGYAGSTTIRNCVNKGNVSGGSSVGGIIGSFVDTVTITGCYNTGAVTGTSCAGGIVGNGSGYTANIEGCYNTGAVSGSDKVGGLAGTAAGNQSYADCIVTVTDCYSVGVVTGESETGGLVGSFDSATATAARVYYLDTAAASDPVAEALDETWMRNADLDSDLFGPTCHGYPALLWQNDVQFHVQGAQQSMVAATCTERGYSAYLCTNCGESYRTGFTAPLGHDFCDHTENEEDCGDCVYTAPGCETEGSIVHICRRDNCEATRTDVIPATGHTPLEESIQIFPAYMTYTCAVCGKENIIQWNDPRLAYVTMEGSGISSIAFTDEDAYPWTYNPETERFESGNVGVNSSTSAISLSVTLTASGTISFAYGVSSETSYDKMTVSLGEEVLADGISGETTDSFTRDLEAGTYTLTFSYTKDSSAARGEDLGWFSGLAIATETIAEPEPPEDPIPSLDDVYEATAQTLLETSNVSTGSIRGEWLMFGLSRALDKEPTSEQKAAYLAAVEDYISENINAAGQLNLYKSTDNSRIALALTALGYDPADFEGYDLMKAFSDTDWATQQGNNGTAFALLAIRAADYSVDNAQALIDSLLNSQNSDGGWAITTGDSDLDATAMVVQALAPDYDNARVKTAVDKALTLLASKMTVEGLLNDGVNAPSAETVAQVLVALTELGRDPAADEQFTKNGKTLLDGLRAFYVEGQGFAHVRNGAFNQMATEQAFYALVAYRRLVAGETSLYDMSVSRVTKYAVRIAAVSHGQVSADLENAPAGATVTITATPEIGYALEALKVTDANGNEVALTGYTFTMPAADVTVTASFVRAENPVEDVEKAIDALTVEKADAKTQAALEQVEKAYDALTPEEKAAVQNADRLSELRRTFNTLLAQAKEDGKDELQKWFDGLKESDYTEENWKTVQKLLQEGLADIDHAENTDEINSIISRVKRSGAAVPSGDRVTVTFRLIGDSQHENGVKDHDVYVTWIPTTTYTLEPGATMYDVFLLAIAGNGLSQKGASSNYVSSIKAPAVLGGYWLSEFDNGKNSGWMYTVNGVHPSVGLKDYVLQDGDRIIWHYVDDYTLEERDPSSAYYYRWLEAEDISPEEYVEKNKTQDAPDALDFLDVHENDWYYGDVQYVVSNGLFNGTSENTFSPNLPMTRAMLVTVLYRLEGEPAAAGSSAFDDVLGGMWYTKAVVWATEHEIVNGYGDGTFGPADSITREQMAAILYRYAQYKDYDVTASNSLMGYSDYAQISAYALQPLKWANAGGLINGRTNTTLAPKGTATRAEVAAILHRFVENVAKAH